MDRRVTPPTRVTSTQLLPNKGKSVSPEAGSAIRYLWEICCEKWEISCASSVIEPQHVLAERL